MLQDLTIYLLYHLRYYNTYNLFIYLFLIDQANKLRFTLQNSVMKIIKIGIPKQTSQVNSKYMIIKNKLPRFFFGFENGT